MPDWSLEESIQNDRIRLIAGVDEAGRGPLAGSVVAAAVILPDNTTITGLDDSKKLSERQRERLYEEIIAQAISYAIAESSPAEIDRINILRATHLAMQRAVKGLSVAPDAVFVDGLPVQGLHTQCYNFIKGDGRSLSIAAASILAKVTRDRQMLAAAILYPNYGFERHKGYAAPEHLKALRTQGPCPLHRRSFAPLSQQVLDFDQGEGD
jgi:ribonuclease HII